MNPHLDFLYGLRQSVIKLGLKNIALLLAQLGHPQKAFKSIHVAGTNGKGSTSACLAAILDAAGYKVGLYTSPHLQRFNERIRVGRRQISDEELAALIEEIRARARGQSATFFEFTTALAFLWFARQEVDFAVIETGMGGRLDATVLIRPLVSIVTPVSFDHMSSLGNTLAAIAGEKSYIIKAHTPVVIGPQEPEALEVLLTRAARMEAPVRLWGRDFDASARENGFAYHGREDIALLRPGLPGRHQHANLATSLCAAELLNEQGFHVERAAMESGVRNVEWPGRLEWFPGRILLDGAHNAAGARVLAQYLADENITNAFWIVAIKWDKVAEEILLPVLPRCRRLYCTVAADQASVDPQKLADFAGRHGVAATTFATPAAALEAALSQRGAETPLLVAGSLFLVGAAREYLEHYVETSA
ncbi:MAG: bifunctional folylpolyglutamate synthase/dihydrofolate synthase [Deltaproteobacteria bacterium]|nr:bifunctional folylpolyglutamate synthase/dihydrofolate synthase [Deltaproteobacteria bacterium]